MPAHVVKVSPVESWIHEQPESIRGEGLVVVVNAKAGSGSKPLLPGPSVADLFAAEIPAAEIVEATPEDDFEVLLEDAAERARVLAVAGGDGTVNAAAQVALIHGLPLLVIPAGTLNHFARTLGLETPADAIAAYRKGSLARVDAGRLSVGDGHESVFLNNASLGVYPELVVRRERLEHRLGKWPALAVAAAQVLRHAEPLTVTLNGRPRRLWLGFVGNCAYGARGAAPSWRSHLDDGLLDVRLIMTGRRVPRIRAFAATLLGHLHLTGGEYRHWNATRLRIRPHAPVLIARDGELSCQPGPIAISKYPLRLLVFVPGTPVR
jgi:undecaprenyl-diphosphatase